MSGWKAVRDQADIQALLEVYGGFHDACLVSLAYTSGNNVNENYAMGLNLERQEVRMVFHRQEAPKKLELCFTKPQFVHIACPGERWFGEMLDAYLSFCQDVLPNRPDPSIVWANWDGFDPASISRGSYDPNESFLVADGLHWRILE